MPPECRIRKEKKRKKEKTQSENLKTPHHARRHPQDMRRFRARKTKRRKRKANESEKCKRRD
jgi:hypothetical protein